jgi:predicted phage tail protein
MIKIIPHGVLCETWPSDFQCEVETAHEAIVALTSQFKLGGKRVQVRLVGYDSDAAVASPILSNELHVVPAFAGGGGAFKIIIGIVLIVVAVVLSVFTFGAATPLIGATTAFTIGMLGASLVLGGILDLTSAAPKTSNPTGGDTTSNTYLGAPKNTVAIGTRIPLGYGRFQVYGQVLSYNVVANPAPTPNSATDTRAQQGYVGAS